MIMVILLAIVKTFFYLRVFESLSYIVTMLKNVIYDLRVFLIFYFMVILWFKNEQDTSRMSRTHKTVVLT